MVARRPTTKPTLDAKLMAWRKAYRAVLGEMEADAKRMDWTPNIDTAATVAAQLVAGADLEVA